MLIFPSRDSVDALIKKHEDFDKSMDTRNERIATLMAAVNDLLAADRTLNQPRSRHNSAFVLRAAPLVRVKAKITVKIAVSCRRRLTCGVFDGEFDMSRTSVFALRFMQCCE